MAKLEGNPIFIAEQIIREWQAKAIPIIKAEVDENTPSASGKLKSFNRVFAQGRSIIIENNAPYAAAVHEGTRALKASEFGLKAFPMNVGYPASSPIIFSATRKAQPGNPWIKESLKRLGFKP